MTNFSDTNGEASQTIGMSPFQRSSWCVGILALCLILPIAPETGNAEEHAAISNVHIVFSDETTPYMDFRHGFESSLPEAFKALSQFYLDTDAIDPESLNEQSLILSVGTSATRWALENTSQTVMASMIPSQSFYRLKAAHPDRQLTALFIDQPPERHMALARSLLPGAENLAIFSSGLDEDMKARLSQAAARMGLTLHFKIVRSRTETIRAVRAVGNDADALLILPGSEPMPAPSLRALLLHSFRENLPVIGYSSGLVSAGSVAAIHSLPRKLGEESAEHLQRLSGMNASARPAERYPSGFEISSNRELARSLRLPLPSDATLRKRIQDLEINNAP
jgi:putative tryptophan/tyrosine transport system substrate-binding protein